MPSRGRQVLSSQGDRGITFFLCRSHVLFLERSALTRRQGVGVYPVYYESLTEKADLGYILV